MDNKAFAIDDYLERIHYSGRIEPTAKLLERIHRAQAYRVPFENFDILLGRGVSLEPATIFDKLVRQARGGYCFELNGLFLMALQAIGFDARALLARVHLNGALTGRSHQLILVTVQGQEWLADVGFGGPGLRAPIPFELNHPTTHDGQTFRLVEAPPYGIMLQTLESDQWQNLYSFDLGHVFPPDLALGNHFTSTHPSSFFTFARVAALPSPDGRIALFNRTLRRVIAGKEEIQELEEGQPYLDALRIHFSIDLDVPYESLRSLPK